MSKDQYDILESIGSGTFGTVYKIRRKADDRILCWKEINFGKMSEKEKSQVVSEVNIIRDLKSPFIVKYYDRILDKSNARLYIIMEYCSGGDLGRLITKHRKEKSYIEESFIWKILSQCLLALRVCHKRVDENGVNRPVLHRDIKPANIFLDSSGQNIKTGDFGLARELSNHTRYAQTNVGTPLYMAPEIINEKGYDDKTDIWSLGCLIYELAALKPAFDATNAIALAQKINQGKFPRIPSKFSESLYNLILTMVQTDPKRRPRVDDLLELPVLQSHLSKAREIVRNYEHEQNYAGKFKELLQKENMLNQREIELNQRESSLNDRELKLQVFSDQLELEKKRVHQLIQSNQSQVSGSIDANNSSYACDMMLIDDSHSSIPPPPPTNRFTAAGFQIHVDNQPASSFSNRITNECPSDQYPKNAITSRVQQLITAKPTLPSQINQPIKPFVSMLDKENACPVSQRVKPIKKSRYSDMSDNIILDDQNEFMSPLKKVKLQHRAMKNQLINETESPSSHKRGLGTVATTHVDLKSIISNPNQAKNKYTNVLNVDDKFAPVSARQAEKTHALYR